MGAAWERSKAFPLEIQQHFSQQRGNFPFQQDFLFSFFTSNHNLLNGLTLQIHQLEKYSNVINSFYPSCWCVLVYNDHLLLIFL